MQTKRVTWGVLALGAVAAAPAQVPAPVTPPHPVLIVPPCVRPPGFPNWGRTHWGAAPIWLGGSPTPPLTLDDTAKLLLAPIGAVKLAVPLGKPAQPDDHGGLVAFHVTASGTYRIALGGRAWIDIVREGKVVASVAHAMGPACSGLAKMVDFRLEPGAYTIQLSAAADPTLRIAITRLP